MKNLIAAIAASMLMASAGTAMAVPLPVGPVTMHWTDYENRLTPGSSTQELTGVFSLDQISHTGGSPVWNDGPGSHLYGYFNSLMTSSVSEMPGSQVKFTGGQLFVYETASVVDLTKRATIFTDIASSGTLFLKANFVTGGDFLNPTNTLVATITGGGSDGKTGYPAILGTGRALLDVIGGTAAAALDTNSYARFDGTGLFADLSMVNTFSILNTGTSPLTNTYKGWDVVSSDPINGIATPEPSTFALLGLGLIGAGFIGRKRMK